MFSSKSLSHSEITPEASNEVIKLKSSAWPYAHKQQLEWMDRNLKGTDIHFFLLDGNRYVAYLNLIRTQIEIDNTIYNTFGVGNVCAAEKGRGLGNELMGEAGKFIKQAGGTGLLFCKGMLVSFYEKNGWQIIDKDKLAVSFDNTDIETMIFNEEEDYRHISYAGPLF